MSAFIVVSCNNHCRILRIKNIHFPRFKMPGPKSGQKDSIIYYIILYDCRFLISSSYSHLSNRLKKWQLLPSDKKEEPTNICLKTQNFLYSRPVICNVFSLRCALKLTWAKPLRLRMSHCFIKQQNRFIHASLGPLGGRKNIWICVDFLVEHKVNFLIIDRCTGSNFWLFDVQCSITNCKWEKHNYVPD